MCPTIFLCLKVFFDVFWGSLLKERCGYFSEISEDDRNHKN